MKSSAKKVLIMVGVLVFVAIGLIFLEVKLGGGEKGSESSESYSSEEITESVESVERQSSEKLNDEDKVYSGEAVVLTKKDGKISLSINNDFIKGRQEYNVDQKSYDSIYVGQVLKLKYKIVDGAVIVLSVKEK